MSAILQLSKIFLVMSVLLAAVFYFSLRFHKLYNKLQFPWNVCALLVIHSVNCFILVGGFFAAEHLRKIYSHHHQFRVEVLHGVATFFLLFALGLPLIYFYFKSRSSLSQLEEENSSHKLDIINFLSSVMEELPEDLRAHASETGLLVKGFCAFLKMPPEAVSDIVFAAMFHNVGAALVKTQGTAGSGITDDGHTANAGAGLLHRIHIYKKTSEMIRHQYEKWDGSGHPNRLKGVDIPLGSRVIAIVSSYNQLSNGRCGKAKLGLRAALDKLNERRGMEFDPDLLDQFDAYILVTRPKG